MMQPDLSSSEDKPTVYFRPFCKDGRNFTEDDLLKMPHWTLSSALLFTLGRMTRFGPEYSLLAPWTMSERPDWAWEYAMFAVKRLPLSTPLPSVIEKLFALKPKTLPYRIAAIAVRNGTIAGSFSKAENDYEVERLSFLRWAKEWADANDYEVWPRFRPLLDVALAEKAKGITAPKSPDIAIEPPTANDRQNSLPLNPVLTELQARIVEELSREAMTCPQLLDRLQERCKVIRDESTVKRALKELRQQGLVKNRKGLGFYLTDSGISFVRKSMA